MEDNKIIARWTGIKDCIDDFNMPYQEKIIIEQTHRKMPYPYESYDTYDIQYFDSSGKDVASGRNTMSLGAAKRDAMRDTGYKSKDFVWTKEVFELNMSFIEILWG